MNWIVIVDSRMFALAFGVGAILLVGLTCVVLAAMDRREAKRKLSSQQDFVWARATRFMELGDALSMALLVQNHSQDLSPKQRRLIGEWIDLQNKARAHGK